MDDLVIAVGLWAISYIRVHPRALGWLVILGVIATAWGVFVTVWSKRTTPEKRALLMGSFAGRGVTKVAGVLGADPVRLVEGLADLWRWLANFVARRFNVAEPYKMEPQAIVTSPKGEPVEVALVEPQSKRVTTLVPAPDAMLEEARAEAEAERRAAAEKEERL